MFPVIAEMPLAMLRAEVIADMEAGFTNPTSLLMYKWKPLHKPTVQNVVLGREPIRRVLKILKRAEARKMLMLKPRKFR